MQGCAAIFQSANVRDAFGMRSGQVDGAHAVQIGCHEQFFVAHNLHSIYVCAHLGVSVLCRGALETSRCRIERGESHTCSHPHVQLAVAHDSAHVVVGKACRVGRIVSECLGCMAFEVSYSHSVVAVAYVQMSVSIVKTVVAASCRSLGEPCVFRAEPVESCVIMLHAVRLAYNPHASVVTFCHINDAVFSQSVSRCYILDFACTAVDYAHSALRSSPNRVGGRVVAHGIDEVVQDAGVACVVSHYAVGCDAVESVSCGNPYKSVAVNSHIVYEIVRQSLRNA